MDRYLDCRKGEILRLTKAAVYIQVLLVGQIDIGGVVGCVFY